MYNYSSIYTYENCEIMKIAMKHLLSSHFNEFGSRCIIKLVTTNQLLLLCTVKMREPTPGCKFANLAVNRLLKITTIMYEEKRGTF